MVKKKIIICKSYLFNQIFLVFNFLCGILKWRGSWCGGGCITHTKIEFKILSFIKLMALDDKKTKKSVHFTNINKYKVH